MQSLDQRHQESDTRRYNILTGSEREKERERGRERERKRERERETDRQTESVNETKTEKLGQRREI